MCVSVGDSYYRTVNEQFLRKQARHGIIKGWKIIQKNGKPRAFDDSRRGLTYGYGTHRAKDSRGRNLTESYKYSYYHTAGIHVFLNEPKFIDLSHIKVRVTFKITDLLAADCNEAAVRAIHISKKDWAEAQRDLQIRKEIWTDV